MIYIVLGILEDPESIGKPREGHNRDGSSRQYDTQRLFLVNRECTIAGCTFELV
jgi:hypothetical protein